MSKSELELKMMGKTASVKYLKDNVDMNETITSMAKEARLNPHQVARICESANVFTYDELWDKNKNGNFTFKLADQEKIAESLNTTSSIVLQEADSSISSIKDLLPPVDKVESISSKTKTAEFEKLAQLFVKETKVSKTELRKTINKLSHYRDMLDTAISESTVIAKEAELALEDMLKTAALRGENIAGAYIAARATYPDADAKIFSIFNKIAMRLKDKGISIKEAGKKYTEDAVGNSSEAVVNKKHPILKHLDTVMRHDSEMSSLEKAKDYIVSKIEFLDSALMSHPTIRGEELE